MIRRTERLLNPSARFFFIRCVKSPQASCLLKFARTSAHALLCTYQFQHNIEVRNGHHSADNSCSCPAGCRARVSSLKKLGLCPIGFARIDFDHYPHHASDGRHPLGVQLRTRGRDSLTKYRRQNCEWAEEFGASKAFGSLRPIRFCSSGSDNSW